MQCSFSVGTNNSFPEFSEMFLQNISKRITKLLKNLEFVKYNIYVYQISLQF